MNKKLKNSINNVVICIEATSFVIKNKAVTPIWKLRGVGAKSSGCDSHFRKTEVWGISGSIVSIVMASRFHASNTWMLLSLTKNLDWGNPMC